MIHIAYWIIRQGFIQPCLLERFKDSNKQVDIKSVAARKIGNILLELLENIAVFTIIYFTSISNLLLI